MKLKEPYTLVDRLGLVFISMTLAIVIYSFICENENSTPKNIEYNEECIFFEDGSYQCSNGRVGCQINSLCE